MVQLSTSILFGVVALSVSVPAILAVPIEQLPQELAERDTFDGNSLENLEARVPSVEQLRAKARLMSLAMSHRHRRGIEDIDDLEARSAILHAAKLLMKDGSSRRVITSPVRDAIQGGIRGAKVTKHKKAHDQATANVRKWHEATRKIIHQQHENNKNRPREYVDELDGRDEFEVRGDWELEDMD